MESDIEPFEDKLHARLQLVLDDGFDVSVQKVK